ncbi:MAG: sulfide/dihydroorotate dehydrogenase-like FAD/NAD-binding protein [Spirochaetia bacterium]|jgi:ferredoxin--NADP+ reductase|nr:sulfide/dihydroorotate dehydrogenase-like FAD/NAD-binding protein [Spirochaetia bacterium]
MNRIVEKVRLSDEVYRIVVEAPLVAEERRPGQFVIVQRDSEFAERIPLTIADADVGKGTITMIFQTVGGSTHKLALLEAGDSVGNILGPLGRPTHIEKVGTVVCVGGGIGVAPMYPIAQGMKEAGNRLVVIMGARNKGLLIMEDQMKAIADELVVVTDDGSYGRKALVTEPLRELCEKDPRPDQVVVIGPPIMMKFCVETTRPFAVPTLVSLNTIMIDGTGMCGGCRVTVGGRTKFVCVDGPEFDGHQVDFANMLLRMGSYRDVEAAAHEKCHLEMEAGKAAGRL